MTLATLRKAVRLQVDIELHQHVITSLICQREQCQSEAEREAVDLEYARRKQAIKDLRRAFLAL